MPSLPILHHQNPTTPVGLGPRRQRSEDLKLRRGVNCLGSRRRQLATTPQWPPWLIMSRCTTATQSPTSTAPVHPPLWSWAEFFKAPVTVVLPLEWRSTHASAQPYLFGWKTCPLPALTSGLALLARFVHPFRHHRTLGTQSVYKPRITD